MKLELGGTWEEINEYGKMQFSGIVCDGNVVAETYGEDFNVAKANARRIVACVNAFAGIDINDFEGMTVAEYVTSKTMLTGMGPEDGGGFGIQFEGGACGLLAHAFAEQFKGSKAVNYLELNFHHQELGGMSVTMQRTTPVIELPKPEMCFANPPFAYVVLDELIDAITAAGYQYKVKE